MSLCKIAASYRIIRSLTSTADRTKLSDGNNPTNQIVTSTVRRRMKVRLCRRIEYQKHGRQVVSKIDSLSKPAKTAVVVDQQELGGPGNKLSRL